MPFFKISRNFFTSWNLVDAIKIFAIQTKSIPPRQWNRCRQIWFSTLRIVKEQQQYLRIADVNHPGKAYVNEQKCELVEDDGIEPTTPCLQSRCSPSWANPPFVYLTSLLWNLVGLDGLEPSTPALSRRCSNQLSYRPFIVKSLMLLFTNNW